MKYVLTITLAYSLLHNQRVKKFSEGRNTPTNQPTNQPTKQTIKQEPSIEKIYWRLQYITL